MKPYAYSYEWAHVVMCEGPRDWRPKIEREAPPNWGYVEGRARDIVPLYTRDQMASVRDLLEQERCRNAELSAALKLCNRELEIAAEEHGKAQEERDSLKSRHKTLSELLGMALHDLEHIQRECGGDSSPGYLGCLVDDVVDLLSGAESVGDSQCLTIPDLGKYADTLAPFVKFMVKELVANSGKGDRPGWLKMTGVEAVMEIYHHTAKLAKAVKNGEGPGIIEYSADVANCAMMVLDICGGLGESEVSSHKAKEN